MDIDLTTVELALALSAGVVGAGYIAFILAPAWDAYGRLWEKLSAGFLTLYMLAALLGLGATIGLTIVWFYDRYT
jgi:hypothetical protein